MKSEWFIDWFESKEYLTVYKHRDNADAAKAVDLILNNINIDVTKTVLDLACGAGRHSISFAQKGFEVVGVDLSDNLLKCAKIKSDELNLQIDFIKSDIRYFAINKKFDLILNLFTSFGYFDTDEENGIVFSLASKYLNEKGVFVFDYFNPHFIVDNLIPHSIDNYGDFTIEQFRFVEGERIVKKIKIISEVGEREYTESVRMYNFAWVAKSIQKNGLHIIKEFGNYDGEKFSKKNSSRIFLICTK
ncbi:MAG: methyltransferase domain-containing protein [Ignavibacteria bacterium]|nr:methyltransferase domain-containing protein [Ignavibacteria bacterium]